MEGRVWYDGDGIARQLQLSQVSQVGERILVQKSEVVRLQLPASISTRTSMFTVRKHTAAGRVQPQSVVNSMLDCCGTF